MYRQIKIHLRDRHLQSILWRDTPSEPIKAYQLTTVTYGTSAAPFLANRTMRQLAEDEKHLSQAAQAILKETYMDDVLSGGHSTEEAKEKQRQLIEMLKVGGFPLHKWAANHRELLDWLPDEKLAKAETLSLDKTSSVKVLGLSWAMQDDSFCYRLNIEPIHEQLTKRIILSKIAQLFDPLGFITPVIITGKILMQSLWKKNLAWDAPLPVDTQECWDEWYSSLYYLKGLTIPRWTGYSPGAIVIELHGYADASLRAYAAVVYIRVLNASGGGVNLVQAKSKVAPVNAVSIPRLELCAALLLARLAKQCGEQLNINQSNVHLWSDSKDTLYWLKAHPSKWQTFVANRCSEIKTLLPDAHWHHVCSADNPADAPSRGRTPEELIDSNLWWHGPAFLTASTEPWQLPLPLEAPEFVTEARQSEAHCLIATKVDETKIWELAYKYSTLSRLYKITALILRFVRRTSKKIKLRGIIKIISTHDLTIPAVEEQDEARQFWAAHFQQIYFAAEIKALEGKKPLPKGSLLRNLSPKLENSVLKVGGRLRHSQLNYDEVHPLILPQSSVLTTLVVRCAHNKSLHGGTQFTLATLRRQYWVVKGRQNVKNILDNCITCRRFAAKPLLQKMGDLPASRVTPAKPFERCGTDYAGPFWIRTSPGRGQKAYKGYIALFVCLTTKAIHLEVVSKCDTPSFIAALKRFIARRGICSEIWSDNGTQFVGAEAELSKLFKRTSKHAQEITRFAADLGIKWRFIPPRAPHFGGLWEAGVKSVKYHLRRVLGDHRLTFEEFSTLLCSIEACLNSRPLVPLSDDSSDLSPLTPSHFLTGRGSLLLPEPRITEEKIPVLKRWQQTTQMTQHFWDRWSSEYLQHLQARTKWQQEGPPIQINDLVLIKNENTTPANWPLAKVATLHPGMDGITRVVTVRSANGSFKRPLAKLVALRHQDE